jgi:hypothetical protein
MLLASGDNSLRQRHLVRCVAPVPASTFAAVRPAALHVLVAVLCTTSALGASCGDEAACQAKFATLIEGLDETHVSMNSKENTLRTLEDLRGGILEGRRVELPSVQRRELEKRSPLFGSISTDARHKPVSTNASKHIMQLQTLVPDTRVKFHALMPLRRSASAPSSKDGAASALLLVIIDAESLLSILTMEGEVLLDKFDLEHGAGREITQLAVSPSQEDRFIVTGDVEGNVRVHKLKVMGMKKESAGKDTAHEKGGPDLHVTASFGAALSLPCDEACKITSLLLVDRGAAISIFTGDSSGGIAVFHRNGTARGRVRVTEESGGIRGLLRGQEQKVIFYTAKSFGVFSAQQLDVQYPPCTGWNSPVFDAVVDPTTSKVLLALEDGDVLAFTTSSKSCDIVMKFPAVSHMPLKLQVAHRYILGLPINREADARTDLSQDLLFFNMAAMAAGYGAGHSKAITLQVSLPQRRAEALAVQVGSGGAAGKSRLAFRFAATPGVEIYELSIKPPSATKSASGGGGDSSEWLNWIPKTGMMGLALVGVVIWNVQKARKKAAGGGGGGKAGGSDGFDDAYLKEILAETKRKKAAEKSKSAAPESASSSSGGAAGARSFDDE